MVSLSKRQHAFWIQLTALASILSFVIVCTSFGTQYWIRATAKPNIDGPADSDVNYGLFKGTLMRRLLGQSAFEYDLYFTCIWGENSCAWSCAINKGLRKNEVERLVHGFKPDFNCLTTGSTSSFVKIRTNSSEEPEINERVFTNGGLWVSTIVFLSIELTAIIGSVALSIINCMMSPIQTYFNVRGIYLVNGIGLIANFFVLMLYGVCYDVYIKLDVSIYDTIVGDYTSDAYLGYSYWILLMPMLMHGVGIVLIAAREKIVNSDRVEIKIDIATETPATVVLF